MTSEHNGKTARCPTDGCGRELTFEDHGTFQRNPPRDTRYKQGVLAFRCPDCGEVTYRCPVCSDPDDPTPRGYFTGETSGKTIACHNCNAREAARGRRRRC